ncbi:class I SAM-dependent methyltransferase [Peribacillus sp. NPDC097295]|uniref:class I SAM-dependent methyltransferase n=1 Tax=Peribacillus sp. NPDC097295 TaxID=3364402 RepID=UPI0037F83366
MEKVLHEMIEKSLQKRISYHDYMESVLYSPTLGYYMREKEKIGVNGDFYTSGNVGDSFGRTLARWFVFLIKERGLPPNVVEVGAGNGKLAHDILGYIKEEEPLLWEEFTYILVDSSPYHNKLQQMLMSPCKQVVLAADLAECPFINGILFSNELFDALPVHVIEKEKGELIEIFVTIKEEKLMEIKAPLENPHILSYLEEQNIILNEHQRYEIPLKMVSEYERMTHHLQSGLLLTIDYGYTEAEWKEPAHRLGSLRGFFQHTLVNEVLERPGEMDLTTHIHFDTLIKLGKKNNLTLRGFLEQNEFLLKGGILEELKNHEETDPFSQTAKRNRAIRSLIMPGGHSQYFRVLLQTKNLDEKVTLFRE